MSDEPQNEQGFGELLGAFEEARAAELGDEHKADPAVGEKVKGKILSLGSDAVFVDIGAKADAFLPLVEVRDAEGKISFAPGDEVEATVAGADPVTGALLLRRRAVARRGGARGSRRGESRRETPVEISAELRQALATGLPIEGSVTGFNKGGAEVKIGGLRCFCPTSQLDLKKVDDPAVFAGRKLTFKVLRIEEGGAGKRPNVVLSRRAVLEEEVAEKASEARARLEVGQVVRGTVTSVMPYGAFLDLGGIEGLLHVSEITHARLTHPQEVLSVGQEIEVKVLKIAEAAEKGGKTQRISLSRRALEESPWSTVAQRFPEGTEVDGRIQRLETFGAFVEIAPGIEGLLHISEFPSRGQRPKHAKDVAQLGQDLKVKISKVEPERRRISLTLPYSAEAPVHRASPETGGPARPDESRDGAKRDGRRREGPGTDGPGREGSRRDSKGAGGPGRAGAQRAGRSDASRSGQAARPAREQRRDGKPRGERPERQERTDFAALLPPQGSFGSLGDFFSRAPRGRRENDESSH
jgi:small subunit ribosomal protein S1